MIRGSQPGPRWRLRPQTSVIDSCSVNLPPLFLIPGSAPCTLVHELGDHVTEHNLNDLSGRNVTTETESYISIRLISALVGSNLVTRHKNATQQAFSIKLTSARKLTEKQNTSWSSRENVEN